MNYVNKPKLTNKNVKGLRDISARRASTIALMIDEARKRGLDESFARNAIYQYGKAIGSALFARVDNPDDMIEFAKYFGTDHNHDIYEMETVTSDESRLEIDFHFCPYVEQWIKMGYSPEDIELLCDIAMDGDRAIGDCFPKIEFMLGKTIAQGYPVCQIRFIKTMT